LSLIKKAMIFGTSYVETQEQRYIFSLWLDLVTRLNPETPILIVDSASPALPDTGCAEVLQLGNNIGHLGKTGRDGWGRAFCAGLQRAIDDGYRHVVHIETDLLFARPVKETLQKMETHGGIKITAAMANPYQFIETGLLFMSVRYMKWLKFIEKYDWETVTPDMLPEVRTANIMGTALFALPLRGLRNDLGQLTPARMPTMFPYGIDWVTHADAATCREFCRVNDGGRG
jgi:hypothetical protein